MMRKLMYLLTFCICFLLGGFTVNAETYGDYEYSINEDNTITITKYNGTDADVVIPDMIEELPVTVIGEKSFMDNTDLKTVTIGKNTTVIGGHAFYRCRNLVSVDIPDTLEKIEEYALEYTSIETLQLPTALRETAIDFIYSMALKSISIDNNQHGYYTQDGILYKNTQLLVYPPNKEGETFVIPNGITEIRPYSIAGFRHLKTLVIPSTVTRLASHGINNPSSDLTVILTHTGELPKIGVSIIVTGPNSIIKVKSEAIKQEIEANWSLSQFEGSIEVDPAPSPSTALTFTDGTTEKNVELELTTKYQCEWNMEPYGATDSVTWTSSDTSIATVGTYSGLVQCIGEGTAVITGMDEHGHSVTLNVTGYVDIVALTADGDTEIDYKLYRQLYRNGGTFDVTLAFAEFKERVSANTTLTYDFINKIEIVNTNPEVLDMVYNETEIISETQRKFNYRIDVKSLGETTVYARITDYDGTIHKTEPMTYTVKSDMSTWYNEGAEELIEITGIEDCTYTGEAIEPKPVIKNRFFDSEGTTLTEGIDYVLTYEDNTGAGDARCIITGIGNYYGELKQYFTIKPKDIKECTVTRIGNTVTIRDGERILIENQDYTYFFNGQHGEKLIIDVKQSRNYTNNDDSYYYYVKYDIPQINYELMYGNNRMQKYEGDKTVLDGRWHYCDSHPFISVYADGIELLDYDFMVTLHECEEGMSSNVFYLKPTSDMPVTYTFSNVSNPNVATVDADGKVTVLGTGECNILIYAETAAGVWNSRACYLNVREISDKKLNGSNSDNGNHNTGDSNTNNGNNTGNGNTGNGNTDKENNIGNNNSNNGNNTGNNNMNHGDSTGSNGNNPPENNENGNVNDNNSTGNNGNDNAGNTGNSGNNTGSSVKKTQTISGKKSYNKAYKKNGSFLLNCKAKTDLTYKSSNSKVATVSKSGKVTIKGTGICAITVKAKGTNKYHSAEKVITLKIKPSKAVIKKVQTPKKQTVKVTWKKDSMADGYEIQYSTSKNFKNVKTVTVNKKKISAIIKNLKAGKKYYIRIRAYKTIQVNGKKEFLYGAYSNRKVS